MKDRQVLRGKCLSGSFQNRDRTVTPSRGMSSGVLKHRTFAVSTPDVNLSLISVKISTSNSGRRNGRALVGRTSTDLVVRIWMRRSLGARAMRLRFHDIQTTELDYGGRPISPLLACCSPIVRPRGEVVSLLRLEMICGGHCIELSIAITSYEYI
jgi:hypothetical protein